MRKTLYIISFAAIALVALTSCAKDQFKENVIPAGEKIQVSINGQIGEFTSADATKATAGSVVRVKWVNGDKVYVYDGTAASIGTLTVTPDDNNASYALLSGEITASTALPAPTKLTLVYAKGATEAPAIAGGKISIDLSAQDQTEVPFVLYSTIDYATDALSKAEEYITFEFATSVMTVNCTDLPTNEGSRIDITKAEIDGVSTVCELTVTGSGVTVAGTSKGTITRTAGFEQSDSRGAFRLALAADPAAPAARNILVYQGSKVSGAPFTTATLATSKSYNTVYQLGEYVLPTPAGALSGKFTIHEDGTTIHFSKGNLWADGSNALHFEDAQWKSTPVSDGPKVIDHVSHFTWSDDVSIAVGDSNSGGHLFCDDDNKQSVDGSEAIYYGLSNYGWRYLLIYRSVNGNTGEGYSYKRATIKLDETTSVYGLILYPDGYTSQTNATEYSITDWETMEVAGCVFLPAAGTFSSSKNQISNVGKEGYYWCSNPSGNSAFFLSFANNSVSPATNSAYRTNGFSIRLVTDASGGYSPAEKVTGVILNKSKTEIEAGAKDTLVATVAPANATHKEVNWSSSDEAVATVDENGEVTGVAAGTAVITATTSGNFTAVCLVTVIQGLPADALKGVFSVSATKKVHFSKGNLWYGKKEGESGSSLHFEDAQWESTPTSEGSKDASHVSHFTWSDNVASAVGDSNSGSNLFCDESHKQSVDGSEAIYYALSTDEWKYLINKSEDENIRKGKYKYGVTVCEKENCLILVPDECLNGYSFDNNKTSYSTEQWATAEAAGIVCLPAAGGRDGSDVGNVGDRGFYWSSTANDEDDAYRVVSSDDDVSPDNSANRNYGISVRLITDVK